MFQLILALLLGIACGHLLKANKHTRLTPKIVVAAVAFLLLVMGAKIGGDPEILALFSIAGAVLLSLPLRRKRPT